MRPGLCGASAFRFFRSARKPRSRSQRRDRDPITGKKIAGTGGFKKATTDPVQIPNWWKGHEHLIAVPTGKRIGAWVLDIDSAEDHDDGVAAWSEIAAEHDPIETREHRSATGGPHLFFNWQEGIGCRKGDLPAGMSVKGEGGYVLVPPSVRKGRSYRSSRILIQSHTRMAAGTDLDQRGRRAHSLKDQP